MQKKDREKLNRIVVIGNAAGGKTLLSRKLATLHHLPLTHIDSIQFLSGMMIRPYLETEKILAEIIQQDRWLLDGFGPLDSLEKRFQLADRIVFIDMPLWLHYWWFLKRQIKNIWSRRLELPENCNELSLSHTVKVIKTIWKVHTQMRPELIRILKRQELKDKVLIVKNLKEWKSLFKNGILSFNKK